MDRSGNILCVFLVCLGTKMTSTFEKAQNRYSSGTESILQGDTVLLETRTFRPEQELQNINLEKVVLMLI